PRRGDDFCLLVEKKEYFNGQAPTYKRILAARYNNAGTVYEGFLFADPDGKPQYYSRDGRSLRAAFLRSPLKFSARISSHFSRRRFHPILKIYRPHLGVDYAAPRGTPVQAIASGRVIFAGWTRGGGRTVKIRHANGFETRYLHLSRIFVRRGQRVSQGQRIGAVGATGLATGPHLDFRILKHGKYLNFERLKPPRARRLTAEQMKEFAPARDRYAALIHRRLAPGPVLADAGRSPSSEAVD
ncbi:MAG TPA: M23 family metallopeptidase, partial [Bryobacterales bacterium]|nr:M23 family metallopeptidase [Bryobacterales bacterium]